MPYCLGLHLVPPRNFQNWEHNFKSLRRFFYYSNVFFFYFSSFTNNEYQLFFKTLLKNGCIQARPVMLHVLVTLG